MTNQFTALIVKDNEWYVAFCPEIPEANGQGRTIEEAKEDLIAAIESALELRREEGIPEAGSEVIRDVVQVG